MRHSLTQRIETRTLTILEDIVTAAYRKEPLRLLRSTDERLARLKVLLRLSHELGYLSHGHYEEAARRTAEAGRLLGGWLKTLASL